MSLYNRPFSVVLTYALFGFLTLVALSGITLADDTPTTGLNIDFGISNQRKMALFYEFAAVGGPPDPYTTRTENFRTLLGNNQSVGVTVWVDGDDRLGFRDRWQCTNDLMGDEVKVSGNDVDDSLYLTLEGLKEGMYEITTFHNDGYGPVGNINVFIDDADESTRTIAENFEQSYGDIEDDWASLTFKVTSNGIDPITITFDEVVNSGTNIEAVLNGFTLTTHSPEPDTLALLVMGGLGLVVAYARRIAGLSNITL